MAVGGLCLFPVNIAGIGCGDGLERKGLWAIWFGNSYQFTAESDKPTSILCGSLGAVLLCFQWLRWLVGGVNGLDMVSGVWVFQREGEDWRKKEEIVVAVATCGSCDGGLGFFIYLIELMDDGGRICVRRVVDGQESSAWYREWLWYHLTQDGGDTKFHSSVRSWKHKKEGSHWGECISIKKRLNSIKKKLV